MKTIERSQIQRIKLLTMDEYRATDKSKKLLGQKWVMANDHQRIYAFDLDMIGGVVLLENILGRADYNK